MTASGPRRSEVWGLAAFALPETIEPLNQGFGVYEWGFRVSELDYRAFKVFLMP